MPDSLQMIFGAFSGFLGPVLAVALALAAALMFPRVRRFIVRVVNLVPAAILVVVGVFAIPLWRLMSYLVNLILKVLPADTMLVRLMERCSLWGVPAVRNSVTPMLVRGERRETAQFFWPESVFPDLYR